MGRFDRRPGINAFLDLASVSLSKVLDIGFRSPHERVPAILCMCVSLPPFPMGVTHFCLAFATLTPMLSLPHRVALFFSRLCERLKKEFRLIEAH